MATTEPETPTPSATPTPTPAATATPAARSTDADIRAALAPHSGRLHANAEPHLVKVLRDELGQVDPALLADAVKARLDQPEYGLFVKSEAPAPGTLPAIAAGVAAQRAATGGVHNKRPDGLIDLAGTGHLPTPEDQAAALAQRQAQPNWASLNSAERLAILADGYRNHRSQLGAASGIVMAPKK